MEKNKRTILLTGGGTMGSVSPLIAVGKELLVLGYNVIFVGTKGGIEQQPVEEAGFYFVPITPVKFHRFLTPRLLTEPFKYFKSYFEAKKIIKKFKPGLIFGTGGFVQVPVMKAARALNIPYGIHQQDIRPSLSNQLVAKQAGFITTTFEKSQTDYGSRSIWTGNPLNIDDKVNFDFNFKENKPLLFVTGGGVGAQAINSLVCESIRELVKVFNILHQTGRGKLVCDFKDPAYQAVEFLNREEQTSATKQAELIVCRAGISTISELSYFKKVSLVIPMPNTHQEHNTQYLKEKNAALIFDQEKLNKQIFSKEIIGLYRDEKKKQEFKKNIAEINRPEAVKKISKILIKWISKV